MNTQLQFTLNGVGVTLANAKDANGHDRTLLDVLRHELGLKATRLGCGQGQCGACTVLKGQMAILACETWVSDLEGAHITTLEGLAQSGTPHALQAAFIEQQAAQCGFCTSGIIMQSTALLQQHAKPTRAQIEEALKDNLCRCGVHERVIKAVLLASGQACTNTNNSVSIQGLGLGS
jgi:nicotinate dehydrogenase subunit A